VVRPWLAFRCTKGRDRLRQVCRYLRALLKVSRSWVYEHTRRRVPRLERLPFVKIGKYVRFQPNALREYLTRCSGIA
jgi:predicted DNA-binding transcriptional regulator AlpA